MNLLADIHGDMLHQILDSEFLAGTISPIDILNGKIFELEYTCL